LLGLIMLSGWLSEQVVRGLVITRRVPRAAVVGEPARIAYDVINRKRRFHTLALQLIERGSNARAYLPVARAGKTATARAELIPLRRGVVRFDVLTLRTSFPFGLFVKERDIDLPGTMIVWPRSDRRIRDPHRAGERVRRSGATVPLGASAGRGEYRSLRAYQQGDDPRDVHWRSTARRGQPVVREYERDASETLWICLDLRSSPGEAAETAVEIAATLAARAEREGTRFGLATNDVIVDSGSGPGQIESVLDTLARARFRTDAPAFSAPADPAQCVIVTASGSTSAGFADTYSGADD